MSRTTVVSIAFWIVFIASFGLYKYFPLIDTVWVVVLRVVLFALAVLTLARTFRHQATTGEFSYHGYPKWLLRFLIDEEQSPRKLDRPDKVNE